MTRLFLGLPAPAKLNLFLHVVGRRPDGYHELQSVMVPVDLADLLDFERRDDGRIVRSGDLVGDPERDLALRAARLLQQHSGTAFGANIHVQKRIPAGSGMGGGSSDAATTLIALNRLWALNWPRPQLATLALQLGADVPFFLGPGPALAEGIGERITPLSVPVRRYLVVFPRLAVSTAEIFSDPRLTRDTKPLIIDNLSGAMEDICRAAYGANDLQAVACRRHPEIAHALALLAPLGPARMTGSGSAVFAAAEDASAVQAVQSRLPPEWSCWLVRGLSEHPLAVW
ncbi:MAG: 4-(cytidine 5'-diphospho)-2-C-methyl-D-erythritol kinase [Sutterellaceae bacterium]|nr:4-(cytidine 5'-diphospho)-2-C-methyl-D-erythritol kinase [Burkholderiaceae bacterium]MCX7901382.1 4-(cytidine 5'-diphospho)-2-C-methyl-D-erythritol kinase [Burkholderiaceae bacterium]MDW8430267.1 4-(cytidine 5'-diphospho)-2-C-methyl-D-erythritol kinase [Sutterellaceae bacterium]